MVWTLRPTSVPVREPGVTGRGSNVELLSMGGAAANSLGPGGISTRWLVWFVLDGFSPVSDGKIESEIKEQPPKAIAAAVIAAHLDSRVMWTFYPYFWRRECRRRRTRLMREAADHNPFMSLTNKATLLSVMQACGQGQARTAPSRRESDRV